MSTTINTLIGQTLSHGRYAVVSKLGEGGMGQVYQARDANLMTDVVIKVPLRAMLDDPEFVQRFRDEIRALVELVHPHIVRITDVGTHGDLTFAVMQYLAGGNLEDRLGAPPGGQRPPQPAESLPSWVGPIAEALDFVHAKGYIHRDVKPANILFDTQGYAYLSDFGVIKAVATTARTGAGLTGSGMVLGTAEYMAPELIMGTPFDGRVDQYALAVTVYESLLGRRPFESDIPTAVLVQQTTHQPPPLHHSRPDLPASLCQAVHRALAKDPEQRFSTCSEFARSIHRALGVGSKVEPARALPVDPQVFKLACPSCGKRLSAPATAIGRKVRCPSCGHGYVLGQGGDELTPAAGPSRGDTIAMGVPQPTPSRTTRPEVAPVPAPFPSAVKTTAAFRPGPRNDPPRTQLDVSAPPETSPRPDNRSRILFGTAGVAVACLLLAAGAYMLRPGPTDPDPELASIDPGASIGPVAPEADSDGSRGTMEGVPSTTRPAPDGLAMEKTGDLAPPDSTPPTPEAAPEPRAEPIAPRPERRPPSPPPRPRAPEPPPAPKLVRDISIDEVIRSPESFAGSFVVPSGYFDIGPRITRRADGHYSAWLVAQPEGSIHSRGDPNEEGPGLTFVVDDEIGEQLIAELASSGRRASASGIAKFEIRPGDGGNWVASIVQVTLAKFDSLYTFKDFSNINSLALEDSVDVVLLDPSGRRQGAAPAADWEQVIGPVASNRIKTSMKSKLRSVRGQQKKQQLSGQAQKAMQQGIEQGRRNQQGYENLLQQMFGGQ